MGGRDSSNVMLGCCTVRTAMNDDRQNQKDFHEVYGEWINGL